MKLPLPTLLGPLVTKHGALVPQLLYRLLKIVLNNGPHTPRRALRAQRKTLIIAICKGIHLFFYDISDLTDRARKQLGSFNDGQANLLIAILL